MKKLKKLFGEINLTWQKTIIFSIIIGVYTAVVAMIPILKETSFSDLVVSFEVWILFGILIIMNSKSPKDSALKCFVFFLISQPLIYIIQDIAMGSNLFRQFYRYWFLWTIACLPMGYIGYYMKKDKWWGLIILTPILIFLGSHYSGYLSETMFAFPRHLLTTIFCFCTIILYPMVIFSNKNIKKIGIAISSIIIVAMTIISILNPNVYSTDLFSNNEEHPFDDTYKVYLKDDKYGKLSVRYEDNLEDWLLHAEFKKAGKTEFTIESPTGEKRVYKIKIEMHSYDIEEIK